MQQDLERVQIVNKYIWHYNKCCDCPYIEKFEVKNENYSVPDTAFYCPLLKRTVDWVYRDPVPDDCPRLLKNKNKTDEGEKKGDEENTNINEESIAKKPLADRSISLLSDANSLSVQLCDSIGVRQCVERED